MKILYNLILLLLITANGFSQSPSKTPVSGKDDYLLDTSNPPVGTMRDKSGGGGFRVQSVSPVISFTEFPINHNMHITSDGNYFYTINGGNSATGQVNKFSLTGTLIQTYPIMIDGRGFSYNPADSFLYVSTYLGNILRIDNLAAGTFTQIYSGIMQNGQASFALSADGTLFYDFYAGTLIIRNFGNGAVVNTYTGLSAGVGNYGGEEAVAVDSCHIYTWNSVYDSVYVYDLTGNWMQTMKLDSGDMGMSLSVANSKLFVSKDGNYSTGTWYGYPIQPSSCLATLPHASFVSSDTTFCDETGRCINFFDHSTGNPTSWQWSFPGGNPSSSTLQNPDSICYYIPGTYPVTLVVSNGTAYDTLYVSNMINFATAVQPTISVSGYILTSSPGGAYQWYFNGSPIAAATDSFYVATQTGTYAVRVTDATGCSSISVGQYIDITGFNGEMVDFASLPVRVFPNPVSDEMTVVFPFQEKTVDLVISDIIGREIDKIILKKNNSTYKLSMHRFNSGTYLLFVRVSESNSDKVSNSKIRLVVLH